MPHVEGFNTQPTPQEEPKDTDRWWEQAACKDTPTVLFTAHTLSIQEKDFRDQLCNQKCPVLKECRDEVFALDDPEGIYGYRAGMTKREQVKELTKRRKQENARKKK